MVHSILDRINEGNISRDGFPYAVVEDALPQAYYDELASHFPSLGYAADLDKLKNNRAYRMLALDTMDNPDIPVGEWFKRTPLRKIDRANWWVAEGDKKKSTSRDSDSAKGTVSYYRGRR